MRIKLLLIVLLSYLPNSVIGENKSPTSIIESGKTLPIVIIPRDTLIKTEGFLNWDKPYTITAINNSKDKQNQTKQDNTGQDSD
jgi:hypothetical protein